MGDLILFAVTPYIAMILAVVVGLYRYFGNRFSYSSISSQFLENRQLFWGSVPWHYGIILILLAHVFAAVFPSAGESLLRNTTRLYFMEISGWILALLSITGLTLLIFRRIISPRVQSVTSVMDWVLLADLLLQIILGFYIAIFYRWGGLWYIHTVTPWLASIFRLNPQINYITPLPLLVKLHIFNGVIVIALFPFTRLVHIVTLPITYLWRPYQVVIWNRRGG